MDIFHFIWYVYFLFAVIYGIVIICITVGWFRIRVFKNRNTISNTPVSVIISVRNEEKNIGSCLQHLLNQDYPKSLTSIIVVNDHSIDRTSEIVNQAIKTNSGNNIELLELDLKYPGLSHKKEAVELAVAQSKAEMMITTDADCIMGKQWISTFVSYYEKHHPKMMLAPVIYKEGKSLYGNMLALEFSSLMASTAGSAGMGFPLMANGANMAFIKEDFENLGGYHDNKGFASGDDVFLLLKMKKVFGSHEIHFIKSNNASVTTSPPASINEFYHQRIRWTSKSKAYSDFGIIITALSVYLMNFAIVTSLLLSCFFPLVLDLAIHLFIFKFCIDLPVLFAVNNFYNKKRLLIIYPFVQLLYPLYIVIIGTFGNFLPFRWKSGT